MMPDSAGPRRPPRRYIRPVRRRDGQRAEVGEPDHPTSHATRQVQSGDARSPHAESKPHHDVSIEIPGPRPAAGRADAGLQDYAAVRATRCSRDREISQVPELLENVSVALCGCRRRRGLLCERVGRLEKLSVKLGAPAFR